MANRTLNFANEENRSTITYLHISRSIHCIMKKINIYQIFFLNTTVYLINIYHGAIFWCNVFLMY